MSNETARYDYIDPETGELIAQKIRFEPKSFGWENADGSEGVSERDLPLYGAHQLPKNPRKAVFFVEGEKAADALRKKLRVPAVCLPGGAGTRPTTKQLLPLKGRTVVLWPDKDSPGRALMRRLYEKLQRIVGDGEIRCIYPEDVPGKGDPFDWLQLGHTRDDLRTEYDRNPVSVLLGRQVTVIELAGREPVEVDWLLKPYVPRKMLTLFEGPKGTGKTWILLKIATMISTGTFDFPVNPYETRPAKVLFIAHEDPVDEVLVPRLLAMGADNRNIRLVSGVIDSETGEEEWFNLKKHLDILHNLLLQDDYAALIIDPINNYVDPDRTDTYRDVDIRSILSPLAKMAEEIGISVIGIRHFRKGGGPLSELGAGSGAYTQVARAVHAIVPDADDALIAQLKRTDSALDPSTLRRSLSSVLLPVSINITALPRPVGFKLVQEGLRATFVWNGTRDYDADEYIEAIKSKKSIGSTRHERKLLELEEFVSDPKSNKLTNEEIAEQFGVPPGLVELVRYRLVTGKSDKF